MSPAVNYNAQPLLILGCGYLGTQLAQQAIDAGHPVDVLTRNSRTLAALQQAGVSRAVQAELQSECWHAQLDPSHYHAICITVGSSESTPDGYRCSYIEGLQSVLRWANGSTARLLYTSSISVYGPSEGQWIDESTPPAPRDWRGETLLESENLLLQSERHRSTILRLGGIYGPGRDRFLRSGGSPSSRSNTPHYYLNLIHVHDAAEALLRTCLAQGSVSGIYNLTDNHPFLRNELDAFVREHDLVNPELAPQLAPTSRRRSAPPNRRIRSSRIQELLQWQPHHTSVFTFLPKRG